MSRDAWIFTLLSGTLWLYLILRAVYNPFVFDEATSFLLFAKDGEFLPWNSYISANNHYLNSASMFIAHHLLGDEEWMLRLGNVLSFPIYGYFIFRIGRQLQKTSLEFAFWIAAFGVHAYLEMFAFARGYGLSFAFMAGALWHAFQFLDSNNGKSFRLFLVFQVLMLFSNLSLLPIAIIFSAFVWLSALWKGRSPGTLIVGALGALLPIVIVVRLLFVLKGESRLYYSTGEGFVRGSMASLFDATFGSHNTWIYLGFGMALTLIIIALVILFQKGILLGNRKVVLLASCFFGVPVFYVFGSFVVGIDYPLDRSILYWLPLMGMVLVFTWDALKPNRILIFTLTLLITGPLMIRFARVANLSNATAFHWEKEQIPDSFYETVSREEEKATINGYFLRKICWEYLNFKSDVKLNTLQIQDYPSSIADYLILDTDSDKVNPDLYSEVGYDHGSRLGLYVREPRIMRELISTFDLKESKSQDGFTSLARFPVSEWRGKRLYVSYEPVFKAEGFGGLLAYSLKDSANQSIAYDEIRLTNMYDQLDSEMIVTGLYIPEISNHSLRLDIYLWNVDNEPYQLKSGQVKIYLLDE